MNLHSNIFSGKGLKTAVPVALGVTGVAVGSVGLSRYDSFPEMLQNEFKKLDIKGLTAEQTKEFQEQLFAKEKATQETLEGLTAQIRAILDTKNKEVDLTPILKKLDEMNRILPTTYDFDFVEDIKKVLERTERNIWNYQILSKQERENNKELIETLRAQKTPVLETKILETDLTPIIKEIDDNRAKLISWLEDNLGSISTQIDDLNDEIRIDRNDTSIEIDTLGDKLEANKNQAIVAFEALHEAVHNRLETFEKEFGEFKDNVYTELEGSYLQSIE